MQEPELNEEKTVLGNVEEGAGEIKAKLDDLKQQIVDGKITVPTKP